MIAGKTEVSDSQIDWIVHVFLHHTWELNEKPSKLFEIPENRDCFLRVEYDFMEGLKLNVTDFQQHRHSYRMLGRWGLPALSHGYAWKFSGKHNTTSMWVCHQETAQENPWKPIGSSPCSLCSAAALVFLWNRSPSSMPSPDLRKHFEEMGKSEYEWRD